MLIIYLIVVIFEWIMTIIYYESFKSKINREGYTIINKEKTLSEKILDSISTIAYSLIPICNVIFTLFLIFGGEALYKYLVSALEDDGYIIKEKDISLENKDNPYFNKEKINNKKNTMYNEIDYTSNNLKVMDEETFDRMSKEDQLMHLKRKRHEINKILSKYPELKEILEAEEDNYNNEYSKNLILSKKPSSKK